MASTSLLLFSQPRVGKGIRREGEVQGSHVAEGRRIRYEREDRDSGVEG